MNVEIESISNPLNAELKATARHRRSPPNKLCLIKDGRLIKKQNSCPEKFSKGGTTLNVVNFTYHASLSPEGVGFKTDKSNTEIFLKAGHQVVKLLT
jgi:hypothetical protein